MIISNIETSTLSNDIVMAWTGIIMPSCHSIRWIWANVNYLKLDEQCPTQEDFDAIPQAEHHDKNILSNIRNECFPCQVCKLTIYEKTNISVMVPISELKRVGLLKEQE